MEQDTVPLWIRLEMLWVTILLVYHFEDSVMVQSKITPIILLITVYILKWSRNNQTKWFIQSTRIPVELATWIVIRCSFPFDIVFVLRTAIEMRKRISILHGNWYRHGRYFTWLTQLWSVVDANNVPSTHSFNCKIKLLWYLIHSAARAMRSILQSSANLYPMKILFSNLQNKTSNRIQISLSSASVVSSFNSIKWTILGVVRPR